MTIFVASFCFSSACSFVSPNRAAVTVTVASCVASARSVTFCVTVTPPWIATANESARNPIRLTRMVYSPDGMSVIL